MGRRCTKLEPSTEPPTSDIQHICFQAYPSRLYPRWQPVLGNIDTCRCIHIPNQLPPNGTTQTIKPGSQCPTYHSPASLPLILSSPPPAPYCPTGKIGVKHHNRLKLGTNQLGSGVQYLRYSLTEHSA